MRALGRDGSSVNGALWEAGSSPHARRCRGRRPRSAGLVRPLQQCAATGEYAMRARRSYLVHAFDVRCARPLSPADLEKAALAGRGVKTAQLTVADATARDGDGEYLSFGDLTDECKAVVRAYAESFDWLFYEQPDRRTQLSGCIRIALPPPEQLGNGFAASLLVHQPSGAGVYSTWQRFGESSDVITMRNVPEIWSCFEKVVPGLPFELEGLTERIYPFLAVQLDESDPIKYCSENAEDVAKVLTGYLESEEPEALRMYVKTSISHRRYERLFYRWTDALAVYGSEVTPEENPEFLLCLIARAVQVFELCVLLRRILLDTARAADKVSRRLWWPRPVAVYRQLNKLAELQQNFIVAPPFQSVEARKMFPAAASQFGLEDALEAARGACTLLERRQQWANAQFLAVSGLAAYLLDKLGVFEHLKW